MVKEGWWMPSRSRRFHYFVEGRALCGGWMFPNYDDMTPDTGNENPQELDCKACFRKLVKLRLKRVRMGELTRPYEDIAKEVGLRDTASSPSSKDTAPRDAK